MAGVALQTRGENIVALLPLSGKATYLSDLKPASYKHIPFLQTSWPYHADRSTRASLLRAGGRLYLKGLGMHSASRHHLRPRSAVSDVSGGVGDRRLDGRPRQRRVPGIRRRRQRQVDQPL